MRYKKIGGGLLAALGDMEEDGPQELAIHTRTLGMAPVVGNQKPARAIVFVHCTDSADLSEFSADGVTVNQGRGKIRTALVPMNQLEPLSESGKVKRIIGSRPLKPRLDIALSKVKIKSFKSTSGLDGAKVVIGIIDTGIDPNHPDFQGRIARIWDQTLSGPGVPEGAYGLELTGPLITASRDTDGHGTHVTGIAAGAGATFQGVARAAQLVIVKTTFQDAHIADGIRYVFRVAEELDMPAVVNLSLGGHFDPHDGTDSLSQIIDDECGAGRIVCCAAGNEGTDDIHGQLTLGAPDTRSFKCFIPGADVGKAILNGWYPGSGKLQISVVSPSGISTPFQSVIATGNFEKRYTLGSARIIVQTPPPNTDNNDHSFYIEIRRKETAIPVPTGNWEIRVKNTAALAGQLHVWALDDQASPRVVIKGNGVKDSHKIGSPGCATSAVTVAAYVTRTKWTDIDGNEQEVGLTVDSIADFSSEGPLRSDVKKPDVTAPGAMIVSCLSADSDPDRDSILDTGHFAEAGTSMACPVITGVIALLLQRDKTLTPSSIKSMLKSASKIPGKTPGTFDAKWGFGLLDGSLL